MERTGLGIGSLHFLYPQSANSVMMIAGAISAQQSENWHGIIIPCANLAVYSQTGLGWQFILFANYGGLSYICTH
jgi:hypothetical protein